LGAVENEIESLEVEIAQLEEKMVDPDVYANLDKMAEVNTHYDDLKKKLEDLNADWSQLAEEMEELE
jgi:ATP-binding cassette subfamily F protein 3